MVSIAFDIVPSTHYNKYTQTNIIITKRKMAQIFYNHEKNNKERTTDTKINEHKNVKYF